MYFLLVVLLFLKGQDIFDFLPRFDSLRLLLDLEQ